MSARRSFLLAFSAASAASCGAAEAPSRVPEAAIEPEPTSVDQAERMIARLNAELGARTKVASQPESAPAAPGERSGAPSPSTADAQTAQTGVTVQEAPSQTSASKSSDSSVRATDRCVSPCIALASMRRAVAALCRMTGDGDARCLDARRTLAASENRVSQTSRCSC